MSTTFKEQLERLKEVTGCRTQHALADYFGVNRSMILGMINKKQLSPKIIVELFEKGRVNPAWLKTGRGPKRFDSDVVARQWR